MKIQQIRPKDKGFYLIALDEGKDLVLHEEIVARHHLKEGQEIDPEELERCKNDALRRKARERAYYLLEYRDHSFPNAIRNSSVRAGQAGKKYLPLWPALDLIMRT